MVKALQTIGRSIALLRAPSILFHHSNLWDGASARYPVAYRRQKQWPRITCTYAANENPDGVENDACMSQQTSNRILTGRIPQTALVALRTCAYISTIGTIALFFPDLILRVCASLSKKTATFAVDTFLVRIGGCLAILFGMYYCGAALDDIQGNQPRCFYISTVLGRYFLGIVFTCIYASTGLKYAWVLALGAINVFSGIQMQRALSSGVSPPFTH